jgi:predicted MFS family arabinose efflux permease
VKTARIAVPGVALIATTFGLARYGYGLLVPAMRQSFGLDATAVGLLGSGAYLTYLAATVASVSVVSRCGPRRIAIFAGLLATAGMAIIGQAPDVLVLALGVIVAGASSGFAFPPFADLAADHLGPDRRGDVLAAISSGTGWGVALAAPAAIALGPNWRTAWFTFAAAALVVSVTVRVLVPETKNAAGGSQVPHLKVSWFICARSRPLLLSAFLVGLSASVYWTFAPDAVQSAQGATMARILFIVVGTSSIGGAFANQILRRLGTASAFRLCGTLLTCSLGLIIAGASQAPLALLSGLAFGITYNLVVAIQVIWSDEVFARRPSAGLAATMLMFALGQILGPTLAGIIIDRTGITIAFGLAAAVMALNLIMAPPRTLRSAPLASVSRST